MLLKGFWMFQLSLCLLIIKVRGYTHSYLLLKQREWLQQTKSRFLWTSVREQMKPSPYMKRQEAQMLWLVLITGKWCGLLSVAVLCSLVCVSLETLFWPHRVHISNVIGIRISKSRCMQTLLGQGWGKRVGGGAGERAFFFRGLILMHYIFSNSLNLKNKQLQQLPSGICSTCVCVLLSFNAPSTKFSPFDFGNIIFIRHKQKPNKKSKTNSESLPQRCRSTQ